ncbi:nitronate monooxygenase [Kitasatospora sp. NBC_00374]|uniref:nitronate monooxygenase n=1 Tax=Kitasatospora sp. NBC_00374 TaxID=2975964 RepID=UPI00352E7E67
MTGWARTRISELFDPQYPIVQGPFGGGVSTVTLATAVSNAGSPGSFGGHHLQPDQPDATTGALAAATRRPFAVNPWVPTADQPRGIDEETFQAAPARLRPGTTRWARTCRNTAPRRCRTSTNRSRSCSNTDHACSASSSAPPARECSPSAAAAGSSPWARRPDLDEGRALEAGGVDSARRSRPPSNPRHRRCTGRSCTRARYRRLPRVLGPARPRHPPRLPRRTRDRDRVPTDPRRGRPGSVSTAVPRHG